MRFVLLDQTILRVSTKVYEELKAWLGQHNVTIQKERRRGGSMRHAWLVGVAVLVAVAVGTATAGEKKTVQGKVTAVAADSVTIAHGAESMTFAVDSATKVVGKGLTTKANEKTAKGEKMTLMDSLGNDDNVSVTYTEMDGKLHASTIKITQKSLMPK